MSRQSEPPRKWTNSNLLHCLQLPAPLQFVVDCTMVISSMLNICVCRIQICCHPTLDNRTLLFKSGLLDQNQRMRLIVKMSPIILIGPIMQAVRFDLTVYVRQTRPCYSQRITTDLDSYILTDPIISFLWNWEKNKNPNL